MSGQQARGSMPAGRGSLSQQAGGVCAQKQPATVQADLVGVVVVVLANTQSTAVQHAVCIAMSYIQKQ